MPCPRRRFPFGVQRALGSFFLPRRRLLGGPLAFFFRLLGVPGDLAPGKTSWTLNSFPSRRRCCEAPGRRSCFEGRACQLWCSDFWSKKEMSFSSAFQPSGRNLQCKPQAYPNAVAPGISRVARSPPYRRGFRRPDGTTGGREARKAVPDQRHGDA